MSALRHAVFWQLEPDASPRRRLDRDLSADSVVVGGGMAGMMCAQHLAESGQSVVLLERTVCGGSATGRSSGFITPDSELELSNLLERYGAIEAKRLWEVVAEGVEAIRDAAKRFQIECALDVQDSLFIAKVPSAFRAVEAEHQARTRLGSESRLYPRAELAAIIGSQSFHGAIRYPGTFAIDPFQFCRRLRAALEGHGVSIYEDTDVTSLGVEGVEAGQHVVRARHVAVCTDHRMPPQLHTVASEVYHIQTFLAVTHPLRDADVERLFPDGRLMVWDTDLIYQYLRLTPDNRLLIGAGNLLYTYRQPEQITPPRIVNKMQTYLRTRFPWLTVELDCTWPGLIGVSKDFVPIADHGAPCPSVGYVTASAGLPWAAALGRRMAALILGQEAPIPALGPTRDYPLPEALAWLVGKPGVFALSHAWIKRR